VDERVARKGQQRCYADVLYDDQPCGAKADYVVLLDHSTMPHYLCDAHMARRLRDWPDSVIWMRNLRPE
jgi:hypothetical protein